MSPQDGLALGLLATLLVAFCFLMGIFVSLARNGKRKLNEVDKLIAGIDEHERPEVASLGKKRAGWERDADWWKS